MEISRKKGNLTIGGIIDPKTGELEESQVDIKATDLTTHGVIVGMTGSGKTGLGIVLLEEALLSGIPVLAIDPKGDLGNLCLTFPDFAPESFEPWMDPASAKADGITVSESAAETAEKWKAGLGSWGIDSQDLSNAKSIDKTIYTPGSDAGVQLDFLGGLNKPSTTDETALQNEIDNTVSGLLNLLGIDSDPLSGREHILLSNLISKAWSDGTTVDMPTLIAQVQSPPMRKLGVIEVDKFYPEKDRTALAMKLNGLIASPSFAMWSKGAALDIEAMLWDKNKDPRAAIVSLSHLEESERQFAITLVLSKLISWMKSQQGTGELRCLVYIDEVMGLAPPSGKPSTKKPILTLLKQARAFGVGLVLSTQNPVDLDYKAMSNAGTWLVGRLQTEQDKARLIDGLRSADGSTDISQLEATIGALDKRQFVLKSAKSSDTPVLTTRWAMNYLAGPLSAGQITELMKDKKNEVTSSEAAVPVSGQVTPTAAPTATLDENSSPIAPTIPTDLQTRYVATNAPWLEKVSGSPSGTKLRAMLASRVEMLFDDTKADLRETQEWEALIPLGEDSFEISEAIQVDFDDRDFLTAAASNIPFELPAFEITKSSISKATTELKAHLYSAETMTLSKNAELKLWSRPGETAEDFQKRCSEVAEDSADEETEKLREKLLTKQDRIEAALAKAEDRVEELETQSEGNRSHQIMDVGASILGGLFGGRSKTRGLASAARKASSSRRTASNTAARLETAQNRLDEKVDALEDLEEEVASSVIEIDHKWSTISENIEEVAIPLEKTDISVKDMILVWVPTN